jgi:hypothetical protein
MTLPAIIVVTGVLAAPTAKSNSVVFVSSSPKADEARAIFAKADSADFESICTERGHRLVRFGPEGIVVVAGDPLGVQSFRGKAALAQDLLRLRVGDKPVRLGELSPDAQAEMRRLVEEFTQGSHLANISDFPKLPLGFVPTATLVVGDGSVNAAVPLSLATSPYKAPPPEDRPLAEGTDPSKERANGGLSRAEEGTVIFYANRQAITTGARSKLVQKYLSRAEEEMAQLRAEWDAAGASLLSSLGNHPPEVGKSFRSLPTRDQASLESMLMKNYQAYGLADPDAAASFLERAKVSRVKTGLSIIISVTLPDGSPSGGQFPISWD